MPSQFKHSPGAVGVRRAEGSRILEGRWFSACCVMGMMLGAAGCSSESSALPPNPRPVITAKLEKDEAATSNGHAMLLTRPDSVGIVVHWNTRRLEAWSPLGSQLWRFTLPEDQRLVGEPAVAANSTLYVRGNHTLFAFSPVGEILWRKSLPPPNGPDHLYAPAALSNSGAVVAKHVAGLVAYDVTGLEMWELVLPDNARLRAGPKISPNGLVFVVTDVSVLALNPNGSVAWSRSTVDPTPSPGARVAVDTPD